ncbi:MAG: GNAT family N-acetyltransferase [Geminicoccaceae bacterium]
MAPRSVTDLYVVEGARCRGVAGSLLDVAEARCRDAGIIRLRVSHLISNSRAARLYERAGLREYAVLREKRLG